MKQNINKPYKGMHTDNYPSEQPEGTYRYALNAVNESSEGDQTSITNEGSTFVPTNITPDYRIIGDEYLEDNTSAIFSVNPQTNRSEIGILGKDNIYRAIVNTGVLNFSIYHQIDATYRLRRGNERVLYWVDGNNKARVFNLDKIEDYYTQAYRNYLKLGGDPNTYPAEKWDADSFNLMKTYSLIPYFSDVEILEYGGITPGSYNFAIQYVDEDLNPTEWVNVSNTVNIYNSSTDNSYETIRGSYSLNEVQKFDDANKSVKLTVQNLDDSYPYYRIAIIQATKGTGEVTKVLVSSEQSISNKYFIYSGNDTALAEISVNEIKFEKEDIHKPRHIEQLENRLIIANTEGAGYNWCEFQKYASKIDTDLVTRPVTLNDITSDANVKNAKSTFFFRGYMPGEVYSFGIIYIMKDNVLSPAFHIPGKSITNTSSSMGVYESASVYPNVHDCISNNYWGEDVMGDILLGEKVRHHKFPSRKEAAIPLLMAYGSTVPYTRYIVKVMFTLKAGKTFPVDTNGNAIPIDYGVDYQITGQPIDTATGVLTPGSLGIWLDVYNDLESVVQINPPDYGVINSSCDLVTIYQTPGNETFDIAYFYDSYTDNVVNNVDNSLIYGIEFNNIEKPHPDVIGFYIVRNKVEDEDKLVIDNCIVGPNVEESTYRAFTHITPDFDTSKFDNRSAWFFSPEYMYDSRPLPFNDLDVQGFYETDSVSPVDNYTQVYYDKPEPANNTILPCIYIEDVQAGTSYNPDVHRKRDKDSDGFSLQCMYKNTNFFYTHAGSYELGKVNNSFQLSAANNRLINSVNYFNVSIDNKIGMVQFDHNIDVTMFKNNGTNFPIKFNNNGFTLTTVKGSRLLYATMRRGFYDEDDVWHDMDTAYQDFLTRPYYKEHMRPIYFGAFNTYNGFRVFNGDAQISGTNFITTMFKELKIASRRNKSSLWKYIVGAVLIVAGAVLAIFTAGAGAALAYVGASLIVAAAGLALVNAGLQLDKAIAMFDEHYSKGLLKCIMDDATKDMYNYYPIDDSIQWFSDRVSNLYIESRVPFGLRSGTTVGIPDFTDAPGVYSESIFSNYLIDKLTYFDRERGGGRMYRGFATAEIYNCNPDYSRFNLEKSYIHLPSHYDCCFGSDVLEKYPTRVWYSEQSFQEERIDNYRAFLPNNYRDVEGEHGEITDLYRVGNSLFVHTNEALWKLPQNLQERVGNELTTYIGTGDFFSIPPQKMLDDSLGSGGSKHKWATIKTKHGVFFVSEVENKVYLHGEGMKDISLVGMRNWFENNLKSILCEQIYTKSGEKYPYDNNPANPLGVGYISCYDTRYERLLITKRDWSIIDDGGFFIESGITPPLEMPDTNILREIIGYDIETGLFWKGIIYVTLEGDYVHLYDTIVNYFEDYPEYFENKSWTISYSIHNNAWVSFHSYLPLYYIHNQSSFYSMSLKSDNIWKHNAEGNYQFLHGVQRPHILELISNSNPLETRTWEDIRLLTTAQSFDSNTGGYKEEKSITHNKVTFWNSRQCSGEQNMEPKNEDVSTNYLFEQVNNVPGTILIDRNERDWSVNDIRDYIVSDNQHFFSKNWIDIQSEYPIDKVVNSGVVDFEKDWYELEVFRDKFLGIRLKFDNFVDKKLTTHFSIETENKSDR